MKRTISIVLSVLMLVGIISVMPFTAGAVTVIDTITITDVVEPVEGNTRSMNATVNGHIIANANDRTWFNLSDSTEMTDSDVFEAGKEYSFVIFLRPEEGYEFKTKQNNVYEPDVTATVNSKDAYVYSVSGHKSSEYIEIAYAFIVEESANTVDKVMITDVTDPVAGQHPIESAVVSNGAVLDEFAWFDKTDDNWMFTSDTFKDDHVYEAKAYLSAANGYKFKTKDGKPDVNATINGRVAKVNSLSGEKVSEKLVATITYGEYTVSFDSNGASGDMDSVFGQKGTFTLPECEFTPDSNTEFDGWAVGSPSGDKYSAGSDYEVTEDVTFYAVWKVSGGGHEHEWGQWQVTKKASPDEDGEETRECLENPAHTETRTIAQVSTVNMNKFKFTYNGKVQKPSFTVYDSNGKKLKAGTDYSIIYPASSKNVGLYLISVMFTGDRYDGLLDFDFAISAAKNPLTVKGLTKTVKASVLKKKNVAVTALKVTKAQGTKSFKKVKGNKKITVNSKTGKLTLKKGLKKGTYSVKVKVTAKGNRNYQSGTKTVTAKIKVK